MRNMLFSLGSSPHRPHRRDELPRPGPLRELRREVLDDDDGADGGAGHGGGDREALLLAVDLDGPVPGLGPEDDASAGPERGPVGAAAGPASLLLRVGLPAAAPDLAAREGGRRAAAPVLEVGDHGAVDHGARGVRGSGAQVQEGLADLLAGEVEDGEGGGLAGDGEGLGGQNGELEFGMGVELARREEDGG
ncbi:60S ribosomal protein L22-2 [Spatholobus suberectus]|nr:60S ribosomal protein L22-2 [Spatholobus suberectus]